MTAFVVREITFFSNATNEMKIFRNFYCQPKLNFLTFLSTLVEYKYFCTTFSLLYFAFRDTTAAVEKSRWPFPAFSIRARSVGMIATQILFPVFWKASSTFETGSGINMYTKCLAYLCHIVLVVMGFCYVLIYKTNYCTSTLSLKKQSFCFSSHMFIFCHYSLRPHIQLPNIHMFHFEH